MKQKLENHVTVIISATANATEIHIIHVLEESTIGSKRLSRVLRKLKTSESQLNEPNSSEKVITKVMRWFSSFGLELFLKLATFIADRLLKSL